MAVVPSSALATTPPPVPAYGETGRFGGLEGATYAASSTTGLKGGGFVSPVGMAVDTEDPLAPEQYAVYVLDNVNPQELNSITGAESFKSLALEYRIQKLDNQGHVLASTAFTLKSSAAEPGLHAVSLAVDGASDRVYVLSMDTPPTSGNSQGNNAVDRIEAWTTGRSGAALTGVGQLAGVATLQTGDQELIGNVNGTGIAVAGKGAGTALALAGNEYTSPIARQTVPVIELISTASGGSKGKIVGTWHEAGKTEDPAAKAWVQESEKLDSLSSNPDGSLNASLGPRQVENLADNEPNMAKVSADLKVTEALLPWANAKEGAEKGSAENYDRTATDRFTQDLGGTEYGSLESAGASFGGGTLAPSVVQLAGDGSQFPSGLYAGVVAQTAGQDPQSPAHANYPWNVGSSSSNLAIRIFDTEGHSLAMIGNLTAGGPCNLQGGPAGDFGYNFSSVVALAAGRNGVLFALVQPDLDSTTKGGGTPTIAPGSPVGAGMGDRVVEFAPGAGQNGASGQACPQPSGGFSITNLSQPGSLVSTGSGPLTVPEGTRVKLDASEASLQGGSPWAYEWISGDGATKNSSWHAEGGWQWPSPLVEFEYNAAGSYTATLHLVNDFGTLSAQRTVNVVKAEPITGAAITVSGALTAGQPVSLQASATLPQFDSFQAYHWDFGDGQGEDQTAAQTQHVYAAPGSYPVKLTITDAIKQTAEATQMVAVLAPREAPTEQPKFGEAPKGQPKGSEQSKVLEKAKEQPKTLTRAQQLTKALKACRKVKPKRRRASCEKQAKKKYGPKAAKKKDKKRRR